MKDISKLCLRRNSIASYSIFSEIFSNFVLAEIQLHRAEKNVRHFQVCLSRNSIASFLKYPKTSFTCVPVESRLHTNETVFKHFQIVCQPKIICLLPKLFWDILKLFHDRKSIASYRNSSKIFSTYLLAEIQLQCTKNIERHFQKVS